MFYALGQASPEEMTYFLLNIFYALARNKTHLRNPTA